MFQMKDLVPSAEWQAYIIGAREIVVTLFDTLLQLAIGVTLICIGWIVPYALLKVFLWKRVDEFLFPIALALVAGSCWCTQLGWTPIPSEQGPPIPYEYQIFAWSLWIGGFLAIVPGIGHVWNKHVTSRQGAAVSTIFGFFLSYALSLLATSLGNWTRDGAGWHLNDAGFSKQTFCYSVFLIAGAILAHSVSSLVVAGFQLCRLGSHFPPAIVLTGLSWAMIILGAYFAEEHGGHGLWTFSIYMHFEIAFSAVMVFGGIHVYVLALSHAVTAQHVTGLVGNVRDLAAGVGWLASKVLGSSPSVSSSNADQSPAKQAVSKSKKQRHDKLE